MQPGFTVYTHAVQLRSGPRSFAAVRPNLIPLFNQLGQRQPAELRLERPRLHRRSLSYPLRRSFARLGLSYGYDISNITTLTRRRRRQYFQYINFQGVGGPNSLSGIKTSQIIPSYTYNTVNHPITPTGGRVIFFSIDIRRQRSGRQREHDRADDRRQVFPRRLQEGPRHRHARPRHGSSPAMAARWRRPFNRFYMGGENDIRGFEIWGISPMAFIPSEATVDVLNDDGIRAYAEGTWTQTASNQFQPVTQQIPDLPVDLPRRRHAGASPTSSTAFRSSARSLWRRSSTPA